MRDFWNPYYDGPDCVCCSTKKDTEISEGQRILRAIKEDRAEIWYKPRIIEVILRELQQKSE